MKNPHAVALGTLGGQSKSGKKRQAVKENLKKARAALRKKRLDKAVSTE